MAPRILFSSIFVAGKNRLIKNPYCFYGVALGAWQRLKVQNVGHGYWDKRVSQSFESMCVRTGKGDDAIASADLYCTECSVLPVAQGII